MPYLKFSYPVKGRKAGEVAFVSPAKAAGYLRDGVATKTTPPTVEDLPAVAPPALKPPVRPTPKPSSKSVSKPKSGE